MSARDMPPILAGRLALMDRETAAAEEPRPRQSRGGPDVCGGAEDTSHRSDSLIDALLIVGIPSTL